MKKNSTHGNNILWKICTQKELACWNYTVHHMLVKRKIHLWLCWIWRRWATEQDLNSAVLAAWRCMGYWQFGSRCRREGGLRSCTVADPPSKCCRRTLIGHQADPQAELVDVTRLHVIAALDWRVCWCSTLVSPENGVISSMLKD